MRFYCLVPPQPRPRSSLGHTSALAALRATPLWNSGGTAPPTGEDQPPTNGNAGGKLPRGKARRGLRLAASRQRSGTPGRTRRRRRRASATCCSSPSGRGDTASGRDVPDGTEDLRPESPRRRVPACPSAASRRRWIPYLVHQLDDTLLVGLVREVLPAGERREVDRLLRGILVTVEVLSPAARREFLAAVEPVSLQRLAVQQARAQWTPGQSRTRSTRKSGQPCARQ